MIAFQQTDTAAPCLPAPYCSGVPLAEVTHPVTPRCPRAPASPGTATRLVFNSNKFVRSTLFFQVIPAWSDLIPMAGPWTVRFRLTQVPLTNHRWMKTYICHVTAAGCLSLSTLGVSNPAKQMVLGVNTDTVPAVAVPARQTPNDTIFIVVTTQKIGGWTLSYVADQLIDTPYQPHGIPVPDVRHYLAQASGSFGPTVAPL